MRDLDPVQLRWYADALDAEEQKLEDRSIHLHERAVGLRRLARSKRAEARQIEARTAERADRREQKEVRRKMAAAKRQENKKPPWLLPSEPLREAFRSHWYKWWETTGQFEQPTRCRRQDPMAPKLRPYVETLHGLDYSHMLRFNKGKYKSVTPEFADRVCMALDISINDVYPVSSER